jgi:3-phosphoshikimate 1-carboxyvinyltransferase
MSAFTKVVDLQINGLHKNSLQCDSAVEAYYEALGVVTTFNSKGVHLSKKEQERPLDKIHTDLSKTPDLAQTLAVTYAAKEMYAELYGLKTLRIKETDRIKALINELKKIGVIATDLDSGNLLIPKKKSRIHTPLSFFETYSDHRMAMCLAPLSMIFDKVEIANPMVVTKSYPGFWTDLRKLGFGIEELN